MPPRVIRTRDRNPDKKALDSRLDQATEATVNKTYAPEDRRKIIEARVAMGWTQKDLAMRCNMPLNQIALIEGGRAVYSGPVLGKIKRVLNVQ